MHTFHMMDPSLSLQKQPRLKANSYQVDFAFGQQDDNQTVYESIMHPLIDQALKGGISSLFAYGQTGSGKTFTIQGILDRLGLDLFQR